MGEVYRARDSQLGRDVAIKILPEFDTTPDILERFGREAKAVAALNHPHIVTIYAIEDFGLQRFLVMELVEGQTLAEVIPDSGMAAEELLGLATSLADALVAAHRRGVTHRDLKPANIMVNEDGAVSKRSSVGAISLRPISSTTSRGCAMSSGPVPHRRLRSPRWRPRGTR